MYTMFVQKNVKSLKNDFTLMIYSDKWTSEMEFVYLISQKLKIRFLWLRPIMKNVDRIPIKLKKRVKENPNKFKIHTEFINDHYSSPVMFDMLTNSIDKQTWIFRLDNDEIVSEKSLKHILKALPLLDKNVAYSFPRLWIKKFGKVWFYSGIAATHQQKYDLIYRLFTMNRALPITGVHSGGIKHKKTKKLQINCFILHLIYLREGLESRIEKIVNYEKISPGSGHSKIRHYVPELFPKSIWQSLPNSEVKLINLFVTSKKHF